jgi:uncharacterized phiE125 gp8 family phage protein
MPVQLVPPVTPPPEPVSLADAKAHLRVDIPDDDNLIENLIVTAREIAETETRRALTPQTWKLILDAFPANPQSALTWQFDQDRFRLPFPPLQSVTSIVYTDLNGVPATISPSMYQVDTASEPGRIALVSGQVWPTTALATIAGVVVTFVTGYPTPAAVPQSIKQGMLLVIGAYYENHEDLVVDKQIKSIELPRGAASLFWRNAVREAS